MWISYRFEGRSRSSNGFACDAYFRRLCTCLGDGRSCRPSEEWPSSENEIGLVNLAAEACEPDAVAIHQFKPTIMISSLSDGQQEASYRPLPFCLTDCAILYNAPALPLLLYRKCINIEPFRIAMLYASPLPRPAASKTALPERSSCYRGQNLSL